MQSKYLGNKGSMGKKEIEEIEEGLPFSPGFVLSHFHGAVLRRSCPTGILRAASSFFSSSSTAICFF